MPRRPASSSSLPSLALALALAGTACDGEADDPPAEHQTFIATQSDFEGFAQWERFSIDDPAVVPNHVAGIRSVFLNQRPAADALEFPVGTIIVKWNDSDLGSQIHAMVKRGGDYNLDGAHNWEWFDLTFDDEGAVVIRWRGLAPPTASATAVPPEWSPPPPRAATATAATPPPPRTTTGSRAPSSTSAPSPSSPHRSRSNADEPIAHEPFAHELAGR